jgi:hypothetical protein
MAPLGALIALSAALASGQAPAAPPNEAYAYGVEWRFVRAGEVNLNWTSDKQAELKLKTVGLVSSLYKVDDLYKTTYDHGFCATSLALDLHEGRRNREVRVTFDRARKHSTFTEKDLNNGANLTTKEMEVPECVHDVAGALRKLRTLKPAVGSTIELPVSDGKKVIMAKVEAQAKETVRTPLGEFNTIRYEAFLFNGIFYARKGRLFLWISDDDKRLPVQIRVQLPFYVGTITLQLEKTQ